MPDVIERTPCVYILANREYGAMYVGVTSNLVGRVMQHRDGRFDGHTKKYGIVRLVWFEVADTMEAAIAREKQLKRGRREWKRNLIERRTRCGMIWRWGSGCLHCRQRLVARQTPEQVRGDEWRCAYTLSSLISQPHLCSGPPSVFIQTARTPATAPALSHR
jgi:putative endonuclease